MISTLGVIPARIGSTRLNRKPLQLIKGFSVLERVFRSAQKSRCVTKLVVSTDSEEIRSHALGFGAEVIMSSPSNKTGTDRVIETYEILKQLEPDADYQAIANIQGDMPFIRPEVIDLALEYFEQNISQVDLATIAVPISDSETFLSDSAVKVALTEQQHALYFSRAPIPHSRDKEPNTVGIYKGILGYKHIGLYVFSPKAIKLYKAQSLCSIEEIEKLEQLRLLNSGGKVGVAIIDPTLLEHNIEIDTPQDLAKANLLAK